MLWAVFLESWKHNSVSAFHPLIACYGIQKPVEQHLLVHQRYFKINSFWGLFEVFRIYNNWAHRGVHLLLNCSNFWLFIIVSLCIHSMTSMWFTHLLVSDSQIGLGQEFFNATECIKRAQQSMVAVKCSFMVSVSPAFREEYAKKCCSNVTSCFVCETKCFSPLRLPLYL